MKTPRSSSLRDRQPQIYDVIGLGFGPSNLALQIAIEEESESAHGRKLSALYIERKKSFQWHPGMLLDGARIQLTFLKDLVTLRNPQSRFTFLNYLRERGRLDRFANLRNFYPTRLEFNDYYNWVAKQVEKNVRYGGEVMSIVPVEDEHSGRTEVVRVLVRDVDTGEPEEYLTRNLVVATGGVPQLPENLRLPNSPRTIHSRDFLLSIPTQCADRSEKYRFVVVGSGQSAAEIFEYLYTNYPNADVKATMRRFAYHPADESHFVNEVFFPKMEEFLYDLPAEKRRWIIQDHRDTNYSAVDRELIQAIYEDLYQFEVAGIDRVQTLPFLELRDMVDDGNEVQLTYRDLVREEDRELRADYVVLATGYERPQRHPLLEGVASHLIANEESAYQVDRYYCVKSSDSFEPRVFLQGFCEDTHGLSDTLLSTLPLRSVQILQSMRVEPPQIPHPEELAFSAESVGA